MRVNRTLSSLLALTILSSATAIAANTKPDAPIKPKNIVFVIGDGMGPAYTTAYRYYKDDPNTDEIEPTIFDRLLVGMARTSPAKVSGYVTDSAASATALSAGVKTYNGAIGVDEHKHPVTTLLEKAKATGKSIGVAVTSQVNHATPASFLAHNESRKNYEQIAEAYLDSDADVIIGGGQRYFSDDLIKKFEQKGYQYLNQFEQLDAVQSGKVLGLFADVQLPWVLDNPQGHQLSKMTDKALSLLSQNDKGFVLVVEGSIIDWAGHGNDIATVMGEMDEFANTLATIERFINTHPDTLMVVTADHDTGGLTVGANDKKSWNPAILHKLNASPQTIVSTFTAQDNWQDTLIQKLGFKPSDEEWNTLIAAKNDKDSKLTRAIIDLVNIRSNTGWTSDDHTAVDVQVFAMGPASKLFIGSQDNTEIAKKLDSLLPPSKSELMKKSVANK
ncbi:MAG: alkaline phosphatase [Shewanella sp.]|nr:alkaline phosphatase [Shewanella sp.]